MAGKIIEIIVLLLGLLITAAIVVKIPLDSYNEYKDYLAQIEEQKKENEQAAIKPELESITVELKDGIRYFANDLASPMAEHFTVTANYVKGEEKYSEEVEAGKFDINAPVDFYSKGGIVKITFKGISESLEFKLEPVVIENIVIASNPYVTKYGVGNTFDATGMTVKAVYNDGSSKVLTADEYSVDTSKALTINDKEIVVSYTIGEITKTAKVAIAVSETIDDGGVKEIVVVDKATVNAGDVLTKAKVKVNAIYESGNRKALAASEFDIVGSTENVKFGKSYEITLVYKADTSISVKTDVVVLQTVQGENGEIAGGKKNTETEYVVVDGVLTKTSNKVSFAGNFDKAVNGGEDAYVILNFNSESKTQGSIIMRCSNSYCCFVNGTNENDGYIMQPLQINTVLDLTINGREVQIPASVVLKGCGPDANYAPLYGVYYEVTIDNVEFDAGVNIVKFNFKKSTAGAVNAWGDTLGTMNIDYVTLATTGDDIPENYTISGIEIANMSTAEYGMNIADFKVNAVGIIEGGKEISISDDMYNVVISGGKEGATTFGFGTYTVTVSLVSNPSITASKEFVIAEFASFEVLHAGVVLEGDKVYYVFTGTSTGYKKEDIVFFDESKKFDYTVEVADGKFVLKVDATNLAEGTVYPHLKIANVNYDNGGANTNGDVLGRGLTYTEGEGIVIGGKSYIIKTEYSMPTLVIAKTTGNIAVINSNYTSDKTLLGSYSYGSKGVTVSGGSKSKDNEYVGGIGGMDQKNYYVTYTFTLSKAGKVDFLWNIAGNYYNYSTKGNKGLTNAADHIKVTLDGKEISFAGIALPAGSGTPAEIWWNLQQIVISDVSLSAGTHTFTCTILNDGSGLNIGSMEIYHKAN
jgi:hypothetical protein